MVMKNLIEINENYHNYYKKLYSNINDFGGKIISVNINNISKVDDEIKLFLNKIIWLCRLQSLTIAREIRHN